MGIRFKKKDLHCFDYKNTVNGLLLRNKITKRAIQHPSHWMFFLSCWPMILIFFNWFLVMQWKIHVQYCAKVLGHPAVFWLLHNKSYLTQNGTNHKPEVQLQPEVWFIYNHVQFLNNTIAKWWNYSRKNDNFWCSYQFQQNLFIRKNSHSRILMVLCLWSFFCNVFSMCKL